VYKREWIVAISLDTVLVRDYALNGSIIQLSRTVDIHNKMEITTNGKGINRYLLFSYQDNIYLQKWISS
jgi:hypothetical protein